MSRLRHEAGQTVVLIAVLLPLFLGLGAIAVDVGYWYVVKKTAQDAADAAALAAARELPDANAAIDKGKLYARNNMPDADEVSVLTPYTPVSDIGAGTGGGPADPMKVVVIVSEHARTFFGRMFGIFDAKVTARAVAELRPAVNEIALHAHETGCGNEALVVEADNVSSEGVIQSNGSFRVDGNDFSSGPAGAGGPSSCPITVTGSNASFGGSPQPALHPFAEAWPMFFIPAEFNCDFEKKNFMFDVPNAEIPEGVYCAEESFDAIGDGQTGNITVLSPSIEITGNNQRFAPAPEGKNLLFFHIANGVFDPADDFGPDCQFRNRMLIDGTGFDLKGVLFNPCADISIQGSGSIDGLVEGLTVDIRATLDLKAGVELPSQVRAYLVE
jgi:hypothetical protein